MMEVFDKAGKAVGDVIAKARERERVRLEDRLRQLDRIEAAASTLFVEGKRRAGYSWDKPVEESRRTMIAAAATIGDDPLVEAVDAYVAIDIPWQEGTRVPVADLEKGFRGVISALSEVRRQTLADD